MSEQQPPWNPYGQQGQEFYPDEIYASPGTQPIPLAQPPDRGQPYRGRHHKAPASSRRSTSTSQDGRSGRGIHTASRTSSSIRVSSTHRLLSNRRRLTRQGRGDRAGRSERYRRPGAVRAADC